jgi:hypothetical protein
VFPKIIAWYAVCVSAETVIFFFYPLILITWIKENSDGTEIGIKEKSLGSVISVESGSSSLSSTTVGERPKPSEPHFSSSSTVKVCYISDQDQDYTLKSILRRVERLYEGPVLEEVFNKLDLNHGLIDCYQGLDGHKLYLISKLLK